MYYQRVSCMPCLLVIMMMIAHIVHAATCSEDHHASERQVVDKHKTIFANCNKALGISEASLTAFIDEKYVNDAKSVETICEIDACVRALIAAMEEFPDCCVMASTSKSTFQNLPRLADDILHQCDLQDEKVLAAELEKEIAKLPDLKVQIRDVNAVNESTVRNNSSDNGFDMIFDVKKRELVKAGIGLSAHPDAQDQSQNQETSSAARTATSTALLWTIAVMILWW